MESVILLLYYFSGNVNTSKNIENYEQSVQIEFKSELIQPGQMSAIFLNIVSFARVTIK